MEAKDLQLLEAGLGNVTWWGYSPSFNILEKLDPSDQEETNVFLIGSSDGRHFLEALSGSEPAAESFKHLIFWILEQNLMTMARQMLFISIMYDTEVSSATEKAQMFLEIHGNTELRQSTFTYFLKKCEQLRDMIVHEANKEEGEENKLSSKWIEVDMSQLRYKDLDLLEGIFKLWLSEGREAMSVKKAFEVRLRQLLQSRIESLEGVIDLDYQMRLVDRGGGGISNLEYTHFRKTGNAFDFNAATEESTEAPHTPNNSLVSSLVTHKDGDRLSRRGYWGDIITGPFITYGLEFKKEVDMNTTKTARTAQALALERIEKMVENFNRKMEQEPGAKRICFRFLPTNIDRDLGEAFDPEDMTFFVGKNKEKFDRVFIGCSLTQLLTKGLLACLKRTSGIKIYVETSLYLLHMADQIQVQYKNYLKKIAKENNGQIDEDYDPTTQSYVALTFDLK